MGETAMNITRLYGAALRRTALALAGTALASPALATTASPCVAFNSTFPNGEALNLSIALGFNPANGTGPVVLAVQAQDLPVGAINASPPSPAVCEAGLVIASDGNPADSQVQVAVLLPEGTVGTNSSSVWNGRFLGTGNGGFAGSIATSTLALGLIPSYAVTGKTYVVANTDLGDGAGLGGPPNYPTPWYNCNGLFCGSASGAQLYGQTLGGLYGNPVAIADFGYAATHEMTVASKQLITDFYGAAPSHSYFHGCSTGGQQALMEAQRFPTDYDGILAGSPAYDRTHLHAASAALYEAVHSQPDAYLTNAGLSLAHQALLQACRSMEGGVTTDDFLMQPAKCSFDASALLCTGQPTDVPCTDPNATTCTCLVPDQITPMNAVWSGALDSHGHVLYPGYERGAEEPNASNLGVAVQETFAEPAFNSLLYWAFGPSFTWQSFFATTSTPAPELFGQLKALDDTAAGTSTFADVLNANSADLSQFNANGGKMIMYAGYADTLIPTASTIDYYNAGLHDDPNFADYVKLYLAPGMWHCNSGPGANAFGNLSAQLPPLPTVPGDDVLGALVFWREAGSVPPQITATKYVNDDPTKGIAFQRPLCQYPMNATLRRKSQNPNLASSWQCKAGDYVRNQKFGRIYGPH